MANSFGETVSSEDRKTHNWKSTMTTETEAVNNKEEEIVVLDGHFDSWKSKGNDERSELIGSIVEELNGLHKSSWDNKKVEEYFNAKDTEVKTETKEEKPAEEKPAEEAVEPAAAAPAEA
jgi:hypothetical protein